MQRDSKRNTKPRTERIRASLAMLAFGLGTLAYLVAIDRSEWFVLRPVSGTAAAISLASDSAPAAHGRSAR